MKGLHILRMEFQAGRQALALALLLSIFPYLCVLLKLNGCNKYDLYPLGAALGLLVGSVILFLHGLHLQGHSLASGRTGFLLSRPLGNTAALLWRMLGGYLLAIASFIIVFTPNAIHGPMTPLHFSLSEALDPLVLVISLHLLANMAGIAFRDRSPWILASLGVFIATMALHAWFGSRLVVKFYLWVPFFFRLGPICIMISGLCAAVLVAEKVRTGLREAHRYVVLALGVGFLSSLGILGGLWFWMSRAPLASLDYAEVPSASSRSPWLAVHGQSSSRLGSYHWFIMNGHDGRLLRKGPGHVCFNAEGTRAAWAEAQRLTVANLQGSGAPRLQSYTLPMDFQPYAWSEARALTEDGTVVVVSTNDGWKAYDLSTQSVLYRSENRLVDAFFKDKQLLAVEGRVLSGQLLNLDLVTGNARVMATLPRLLHGKAALLSVDPALNRLLWRHPDGRLEVISLCSGEKLAEYQAPLGAGGMLLPEGLLWWTVKDKPKIVHLSKDGTRHELPIPPQSEGVRIWSSQVRVLLTADPAKIELVFSSGRRRVIELDLASWTLSEVETVSTWATWRQGRVIGAPGSAATLLRLPR